MPFPGQSDGRDYATLPKMLEDPEPLYRAGKLYTKEVSGVAQLFFLADDGTVYQMSPPSGGSYPFVLPDEPVDPVPVVGQGFLYAQDVDGASELVFMSSNGAKTVITPTTTPVTPLVLPKQGDPTPSGDDEVYLYGQNVAGVTQFFVMNPEGTKFQLTPPQTFDFVYDQNATSSGNTYADLIALLVAAQALNGIKRIGIKDITNPIDVDAYDFSDCELFYAGTNGFVTLAFQGGSTVKLPCRTVNVGFIFDDGANDTGTPFVLIDSTHAMICEGESNIYYSGGTFGNGTCFDFDGGTLVLYLHDRTSIQVTAQVDPDVHMFRGTGTFILNVTADAAFYGSVDNCFDGSIDFFVTGNGTILDLDTIADNTGTMTYRRGAFSANLPGAEYQTVTAPILGASQNDYAVRGLAYALYLRISASTPVNITGFDATTLGVLGDIKFYGQQMRQVVNVGSQTITIQNNNASSVATNRILTNTGGNLTIAANASFWLWYDPVSLRWRAKV